jgi:hypothetical protein
MRRLALAFALCLSVAAVAAADAASPQPSPYLSPAPTPPATGMASVWRTSFHNGALSGSATLTFASAGPSARVHVKAVGLPAGSTAEAMLLAGSSKGTTILAKDTAHVTGGTINLSWALGSKIARAVEAAVKAHDPLRVELRAGAIAAPVTSARSRRCTACTRSGSTGTCRHVRLVVGARPALVRGTPRVPGA